MRNGYDGVLPFVYLALNRDVNTIKPIRLSDDAEVREAQLHYYEVKDLFATETTNAEATTTASVD